MLRLCLAHTLRKEAGRIFTKKAHKSCPDFLESIDGVGKFLSHMFKLVCREVAACVQSVPEKLHL
jgi:hypothetical protein